MTLTILKSTGHSFCRMSPTLGLSSASLCLLRLWVPGKNAPETRRCFSQGDTSGHALPTRPTNNDANLDDQVGLVPIRFRHHELTIFAFVLDKYVVGRHSKTMPISCSLSNLRPPALAAFDDSRLIQPQL